MAIKIFKNHSFFSNLKKQIHHLVKFCHPTWNATIYQNLGFMTTHMTFVNAIICDFHDYMWLHDCVIKSNLWFLPCAIVNHGCNVNIICDCKYVQSLMTMVGHDYSCKCFSSTTTIVIMNCPNLIMDFWRQGLFQTCAIPTHGNL